MPNFLLHKGNYTIVGIALTDYDNNPDTTTAISTPALTPANSLLVEPVSPGPGNRSWYVSVPAGSLSSQAGILLTLSATIPATGSGAGSPAKFVQVSHTIDTSVPVDHRAATPVAPSAEQPLPHP